MDGKPKRKYTVSEKVLAASRRNLEKANAIPNEIRYRPTPRRQAACRENLLKARACRAAQPRPGSAVNGLPLRAAPCRWGQTAREQFNRRWKKLAQALEPGDACQQKLLRGMGGCATRWLALLRRRLEREQKELLRLLAATPQNALSSATLGLRLVGVFPEPKEMTKSFARFELRIKRLGRMLWELRNPVAQTPLSGPQLFDTHAGELREALEETSAAALGNPLRRMRSPRMAAELHAPAPASNAGPELPAEDPVPRRWDAACFRRRLFTLRIPNPKPRAPNEWPADVALFHSLVKNALSTAKIQGSSLDDSIERIARLMWQRREVAEREWKRAQAAIESALDGSCQVAPAAELATQLLAALAGVGYQQARVQTTELEREIAQTVRDYLDFPCLARPPSKLAENWADFEVLLGLRR